MEMPAAKNSIGVPQLASFAYRACNRQLAIRVNETALSNRIHRVSVYYCTSENGLM